MLPLRLWHWAAFGGGWAGRAQPLPPWFYLGWRCLWWVTLAIPPLKCKPSAHRFLHLRMPRHCFAIRRGDNGHLSGWPVLGIHGGSKGEYAATLGAIARYLGVATAGRYGICLRTLLVPGQQVDCIFLQQREVEKGRSNGWLGRDDLRFAVWTRRNMEPGRVNHFRAEHCAATVPSGGHGRRTCSHDATRRLPPGEHASLAAVSA